MNTLWNKADDCNAMKKQVDDQEEECVRARANHKLKQDHVAEKEQRLADAEETQRNILNSLKALALDLSLSHPDPH